MLLSGGLGIYYLVSSRQRRQEMDERLEELGGNPWAVAQSRKSFLLRWGDQFDRTGQAKEIEKQLIQAELSLKPSEYMTFVMFLGVAVFFIGAIFLQINLFLNLALAVTIPRYLPKFYLRSRRNRYILSLNGQLVEVAMTMSNSLRAGLSIQQAIEVVARETPPPAGREFGLMARELRLGANIETVIEKMLERLPSDELKVMMTAILVQRKVGGNLARALSEMSHTIAEREKLNGEIRTMTAEARYTSLLIPLLPIGMLVLMRNTMPDFVEPLFNNPIGWIVLAIFGAIQIVAFLIIRRMADIKV